MSMNAGSPMRILIVDDSEESCDLTEGMLLSAGYSDIVTADSGREALKLLDVGRDREEKPAVDVVLLDIVMPQMDGVETCARIRNDPRYSDLPIIMVTRLDDMNSLSNAFVAGATDYVTKPVNRIELVARVRAALKLKRELDRRQERERQLLSFLSARGERRAGLCVDETTGLFVGEVAEAYLSVVDGCGSGAEISIVALMLDRLDIYRATSGDAAARGVSAKVARAVRCLAATVGVIAASYRDDLIVVVAPDFDAAAARALGEEFRAAVAKLRMPNSQSVISDYFTASVVAVTGQVKQAADRIHLLTQAISQAQSVAAAGGDRVVALTA